MTPTELSVVILGIVGVAVQLIFAYFPGLKDKYAASAHKGAIALIVVVVVGLAYVSLACTSFAADLGIILACNRQSVFMYLKAIFILATTQQLTYLFTK